jgi:UDP-glucose 4-epimerase
MTSTATRNAKRTPTKKAASGPVKKRPAPKKGKGVSKKAVVDTRERVVLTGICGALGKLLAMRLHRHHQVVGVDRRPFLERPKDIEHHRLDLRRKSAVKLLKKKKPDAIIHIGVIRNPLKHKGKATAYHFNLETTAQLLRLAEQVGVRKFIFLSTSNLYGPSATTGAFLTEESPLHGADRSPEIRDLVALDMMIQSFFWKQPDIETVILRPVHIVGPHLNNAPSRYLRLDTIPTVLGFDPMIQLLHEDDMVGALEAALKPGVRGIFNLVGDGQAPLSRIIAARNRPVLPVPEFALRGFLDRSFKMGFTTYPPGELDHLKYSCLVDGARAEKDLGYKLKRSMRDTVEDVG